MTLYQKFKGLDIDFSQLGLEPGDTSGGYFCTPVGAEVIGWAGVDGIHCCFVKGFGETVFAVNPSNLPGDYVHPLARSFEDFLRLILACGFDAAEQAWMWNRGEFDAFVESYPPTPEQQTALDALANDLGLTPMEDPYGYIKGVQSGFDYGTIPYSEEYYDLVPEPEPAGPPERPEWKVYFENGFGSRHFGHDKPGKEIPIRKTFTWGGKTWHVPAVYACGKGLVVDFCVEIDPDELRAFLEKWRPWAEGDRPLTPEDQERRDAENPMNVDYDPAVTVNGRELRRRSGNGFGWVPDSCRSPEEQGQRNQGDWEAIWLMEHYGLDPEKGWAFLRDSFPWVTKTRPVLKSLSLSLKAYPVSVPGPRFTVSGAGDSVEFIHPVTGETHTLRVVEYEKQAADMSRMPGEWEYPTHYTAMSYTVEPELPQQSLTVRDCAQGDTPRMRPLEELGAAGADGSVACSIGIIGGADGPTTIMMVNGKRGQPHAACSALHFDLPEKIEWRVVFYQKMVEDMELDLPLA